MVSSFAVLIVTSRILTPNQFGLIGLATGLGLFGSVLCPGGFGEAIIQRLQISSLHLDSVFWFCLGSSCLVFCIECGCADLVATWFKIDSLRILIPVISSRMIADMAAIVPNALISRSMSFHLFALRSAVVSFVAAAVTLGLVFAGYGIWALVISQITSSYVIATASFLSAGWRPNCRFSLGALKELSGYGLYSSATLNIISLSNQSEQILIGNFLGTAQLGLYNFSKRIVGVLTSVIAGSLGSVAHPLFSGIQHDKERVRRGFLLATFVSSTVAFPIFAGLAMTSERIISLVFGNHWVNAVLYVQIQCATGLLTCVVSMQSGLITSQGKANWWFFYQFISYAANLVVIILFAHFGITALMAASFVRYFAASLIPVQMTLILMSVNMVEYLWNLKAPILGTFVMLLSIFAERRMIGSSSQFLGLISDIVTGTTTYCMGVLFLEQRRVREFLELVTRGLAKH